LGTHSTDGCEDDPQGVQDIQIQKNTQVSCQLGTLVPPVGHYDTEELAGLH